MLGTTKAMLPFGTLALALTGGGAGTAAVQTAPPPPVRQRILFDADWRFQKETPVGSVRAASAGDPTQPVFNEAGWRTVHLPHDYVVEGTFTPTADPSHGSLPTMPAWYRKSFTLPASARGKAVWIDFDGVYRDSKVYLNGQLLGEHPSGYTGFRYDISKLAYYDGASNVLAVHVDPTAQEGWWYEGGGIYRHVWLNIAAPAACRALGHRRHRGGARVRWAGPPRP